MAEPVHNYRVTRGDGLAFALRVMPGGTPIDWTGATVEIAVRLVGGTTIELTSPDRITLVDPGDLDPSPAANLIATLTAAETAQLKTDRARHRYQIRMTDSAGVPTTLLKGEIDARFSALEGA
jgi:hypothetical protein